MALSWFNVREAAALGAALADHWEPKSALPELLRRADREVRPLRLNFLKRARLANSFKWRLLEKGVERKTADNLTQLLLLHLLG